MIGKVFSALETVNRWELLEDNNGAMGASGKELCLAGESAPKSGVGGRPVGRRVSWQGSVSSWGFQQWD